MWIIRVLLLSLVATVSLILLLIAQPQLHYSSHAQKLLEQTESQKYYNTNSSWTKKTKGHKIALAVAEALNVDEDEVELSPPQEELISEENK